MNAIGLELQRKEFAAPTPSADIGLPIACLQDLLCGLTRPAKTPHPKPAFCGQSRRINQRVGLGFRVEQCNTAATGWQHLDITNLQDQQTTLD